MPCAVFPEQQLYNIYAQALDRILVFWQGFAMFSDPGEQNHHERILAAVYTVNFPAHTKKNVKI